MKSIGVKSPNIKNYQKNLLKSSKNEVDWDEISMYQNSSEEFIRKFQNDVNWEFISIQRGVSKAFKNEFQDLIDEAELDEEKKDFFISILSMSKIAANSKQYK